MWRKEERIDRSKMGKKRWNRKRIYKDRRRMKYKFWIILFLCIALAIGLGIGGFIVYNQMSKSPSSESGKKQMEKKEPVKKKDSKTQETKQQTDPIEVKAKEMMANMTLEEKVAQMFYLKPETLTGVEIVVQAGDATKEKLMQYPVGGFLYSDQNVEDEAQLKMMLANTKGYNKFPMFLGIEEEGGAQATSLANCGRVEVPRVPDMKEIGRMGDISKANEAGVTLGTYLSAYGFNVDFAPLADVCTNPQNTQINTRTFGTTAESVSVMVPKLIQGIQSKKVSAVSKYFPGNGNSIEDAESKTAVSTVNMEQLRKTDLVPFQAAIKSDVDFIMVGHVAFSGITGDTTPASLSPKMVKDLLRTELKYKGIIITDALDVGVITQIGDSSNIAVKAIQAGCDMLLKPADFVQAYNGVINAVRSKTIAEERIDESVLRILKVKLKE